MSIAHKISVFNRGRKWKYFLELINPEKGVKILDAGYSDNDYYEGSNFLEKHYPFPKNITALGLDEPKNVSKKYPKVKFVQYDGKLFPFDDKEFDVCWSNAVIEHVGNYEKQLMFMKEIKRVAKAAFITTPNKYFPIEVHTRTPLLHFLPKKIFDKYLILVGKKWAAGNYMNLLSLKDLKKILAAADISNYKIKKNMFFFFTLDFVITFGEN